jgi:hypothetical protein
MQDQVLCAELVDHRFECWMVPGRRYYWAHDEDGDPPPRPIGLLVGTEPPAAGFGRACAVHRDDPRLVTCVGFGPLGAESMAGAVGLPNDPWTRAFLGVGRAATSDERVSEPDMPALCTGRSRDYGLGPYTCVLRPEHASRKQTAVSRVEWAEAVPDGTARLSFDGANFCTASADHVLRCHADGGRDLRLTDVREHAAGPGTLYWVDLEGVAWCAGNNLSVQCQDDGPDEVRFPHHIAIPRVTHLAAGDTHACAVTTDGAVWCWGKNADLQVTGAALLDASGTLRASDEEIHRFLIDAPAYCSPTEVLPPGSAVDVACGAYTTCVAREDGSSLCW